MYNLKMPPENPTNADEWANHLAAFSIAQHAGHVAQGAKMSRARDIARDAVLIFIDRTSSTSTQVVSDTTMIKCVELAKQARLLAEKE